MAVAKRWMVFLVMALVVTACHQSAEESVPDVVDQVAGDYVRLALQWNEVDAGYVDAFYGPDDVKQQAVAEQPVCESPSACLSVYGDRLSSLETKLNSVDASVRDESEQARIRYLKAQFRAMAMRMQLQSGDQPDFDTESQALYGAKSPRRDASYFRGILQQINEQLPGDGSLPERVKAFRDEFAIPKQRLSAVFDAAIAECKRRTEVFIKLPEGERFKVEYVSDKPWSGYNWYKGDYFSVIQVNTDFPLYIDRAVDLGCHEGYPGHHTYNVLLEKTMVREKGWDEFMLYPLFSPQSLIAEGSANYGIDMAFTPEERLRFEKNTLFPLAGLDKTQADRYFQVRKLLDKLSYAGNEAARNYLNGAWDSERAQEWLVNYALSSPERASQRIDFFDTYRSYVINYNLGKDIVSNYVEENAGDNNALRWQVFEALLASPKLPADLL